MPKLIFEYGFDERTQEESRARGYLSHVKVQLDNGNKYSIVFYDTVRLKQDLEEEVKLGLTFVAEPGMIVLEDITLECMQAAVDRLDQEKFFESFIPVK
jgi:hypothetical protein